MTHRLSYEWRRRKRKRKRRRMRTKRRRRRRRRRDGKLELRGAAFKSTVDSES